ncbi:MAG: phasin [Rhodoblastus sp.]|nr:phasin [Rhodoblastus sp.]
MTTFPKFEVPAEMREFAIKGVDQARKAFDAFVGAAQKATEQAEKSPIAIPAAIKDLNAKVMTIAQTNAKAAFDHAEALVKATDAQEALSLQTEYLKAQMAALQEQAKELGEAAKSAMTPKA